MMSKIKIGLTFNPLILINFARHNAQHEKA
jgi:hypothetical protein